jgi:hypothetical protein
MSGDTAAPDCERLTGVVFELASQLHVERVQRVALQLALEKAGLIDAATLLSLTTDAALQRRNRDMLEESIAELLRVLSESADPRRPLRDIADNKKTQGGKS